MAGAAKGRRDNPKAPKRGWNAIAGRAFRETTDRLPPPEPRFTQAGYTAVLWATILSSAFQTAAVRKAPMKPPRKAGIM